MSHRLVHSWDGLKEEEAIAVLHLAYKGMAFLGTSNAKMRRFQDRYHRSITIFVNLGLFRHFETVANIKAWIKSHRYWKML